MPDAYLLDTNACSRLWDKLAHDHHEIRRFVQNLSPQSVFVSVVSHAEIEYGLKTAPQIDASRQQTVRTAMATYGTPIAIDHHTVEYYSDIRAALFGKYAPRNARGRINKKWVEDLIEPTTSKQLGIQENDVWIAAVALQRNLVLVSRDRMSKIQSVEPRLRVAAW